MTSPTPNSILNLPSGDYVKYYSQIPKYILETVIIVKIIWN